MINVDIRESEFDLAIQDYVLTRQDMQGIVSRIGQALTVMVAAFALFSVIGDPVDKPAYKEVKAISSATLAFALDFAFLLMVWLVYKQMQLFNHAKSLVDYFKKALKNRPHENDEPQDNILILRYDRESPLVTAYAVREYGKSSDDQIDQHTEPYKPYNGIVRLVTGMTLLLLVGAGLIGLKYILELEDADRSWIFALIFALLHFSFVSLLMFLWYKVVWSYDEYMKGELHRYRERLKAKRLSKIEISGKVTRILDDHALAVAINLGSDDGVTTGDTVHLYVDDEPISDPTLGTPLGRSRKLWGNLRITIVESTLSIAEADYVQEEIAGTASKVKIGDLVVVLKKQKENPKDAG